MAVQIQNSERETLTKVERRVYENITEPLGDFGIWNGQFEQGPDGLHPGIEGWKPALYAGGYVNRVTGGAAGNYCVRGGNLGTGMGGALGSSRYYPVDLTRDYFVSVLFRGKTASSVCYLQIVCFSAAKVYLGVANVISAVTPGTSWVRYDRRVGPNGDLPFVANTRYVRISIILQYNAALSNDYAEVDDVQFQQLKASESSLLTLNHVHLVDSTFNSTTGAPYLLVNGSQMTITVPEPSYLWFSFQSNWYASYTGTNVIQYAGAIDGVAQANGAVEGTSQALEYQRMTIPLRRSQGIVAAGTHTVDLRYGVSVVGGGRYVACRYLTADVFAVRAY